MKTINIHERSLLVERERFATLFRTLFFHGADMIRPHAAASAEEGGAGAAP